MNAFGTILSNTFATIFALIGAAIGMIVNRRPPAWVRRWVNTAEIAVGIAGLYLGVAGLVIMGGIKYNNPVVMYVGFGMIAVLAMFIKAFVSLFEKLAQTIWVKLAWLVTFGHSNATVDPIVHETLMDIGMCMIMCSVMALDGQDIGLTLNAIGWASLASLVALVIMSGAKITIRRKIMGGVTALFAVTYALFWLIPATKEFAAATAEHMQVGQRRAADVIRPNMPLDEVRLHQETEQKVLKSELDRYTQEVNNFQLSAQNHTPTATEIAKYQQAMENVTTLRQALKLRNPETPQWVGYAWLSFYALLAVAVFAASFFLIILPIIKAMPRGGVQAIPGTPAPTGNTPANPAPAAHAGGHGHGGGNFPWKTLGVSLAVVAGLVLLGFIAYRISTPQVQASAPTQTVVVQSSSSTPAPTSGLTNCTLGLPDSSIKEDPATGEIKGLVSAHLPWQTVPSVTVNDGDTVEFTASGQMCAPAVGYAGPNGQNGPASGSTTRPEEFPVGDAWHQALVARIGSHKFQVGEHKIFVVPVGTGQQSIELMDNFRMPELGYATGGFQVSVKITRKP